MSYEKWKTAKTRPSYTTMAWSLVLAAFERDTLLRSNYHGGVSKKKNNDGDNNIKLQRLNDNIISIIKETVKEKFPTKFNAVTLGSNINTRLSQLRNNTKIE
ncbi:uncharacterized protein LOC122849284 [Aphidius gifuensis]|nr:uncharacterized protein LOC122849284 [Aphidius gifuensis]